MGQRRRRGRVLKGLSSVACGGLCQHTVAAPAALNGVGVHTGEHVRVIVRPAPANAGIVFVRTDITDRDNRIPLRGDAVVKTQLGTVIGNAAGVTLSTVEHLLSAMCALGVDNALIEVDGPEVPIMDGSALPFVRALDRVRLRPQAADRRYIEILSPIEVSDGDKRAALFPSDGFEGAFEIAFPSAAIGRQRVEFGGAEAAYRTQIAPARTFGFVQEVEALRRIGLARGGSLANAIVIDGDRILNPEGLRFPDEFARHKLLDAIGDLYVLGAPIIGRFEGVLAGHSLNNVLVRALLAQTGAWRWRTPAEEMAQAV